MKLLVKVISFSSKYISIILFFILILSISFLKIVSSLICFIGRGSNFVSSVFKILYICCLLVLLTLLSLIYLYIISLTFKKFCIFVIL